MANSKLKTLLERSPLSQEDQYNIIRIFDALTPEKQYHIIEHWDKYIVEIIMVRKEVDSANRTIIEESIRLIDTLRDAKTGERAEMQIEKFKREQQTRMELESIQKIELNKKLNLIRSIAKISA